MSHHFLMKVLGLTGSSINSLQIYVYINRVLIVRIHSDTSGHNCVGSDVLTEIE